MDFAKLVTPSEFADTKECSPGQVRRAIRKGELPGAFQIAGRWVIDPEAAAEWVPPEGGEGRMVRDDGRLRYTVYFLPEEVASVRELLPDADIIDPREKAKKRRAERKAKKAAAVATTADGAPDVADPFAAFSA